MSLHKVGNGYSYLQQKKLVESCHRENCWMSGVVNMWKRFRVSLSYVWFCLHMAVESLEHFLTHLGPTL